MKLYPRRIGACWLLLVFFLARGLEAADLGFEPNLPIVSLETKGNLQIGQKVKTSVRIQYPKGSPFSNPGAMAGEVKFRGALSMTFEKRSMAFELEEAARLAGLPARRHWILNAVFIDRSLMRHKLAYDLYASLSAPAAPRYGSSSRFVEVFRNGDYQGAYLLMERVDRRLLKLRNFRAEDAAHACIYKAVDHSAVFNQRGHNGYEQHEPDSDLKRYWEPLDALNQFASSAREAAFFDARDGIGARLDLGSAIDFHLHLLVVCNTDGPSKNFIIARDGARDGKAPPFFFVPWDCDATFGRDWDGSRVKPTRWLSNYLFDRLLRDDGYRRQFAARWLELRPRQFSTASIQKMIDENASALGPAAIRNAARWRTLAGHYPDQLSFEEDVTQMKAWVAQRLDWLDRAIRDMAAK